MKDFNEFLKTLPNTDIAETVHESVMKSVEKSTNDSDKLARIISTATVQVTLSLLAEYHKWLQQP